MATLVGACVAPGTVLPAGAGCRPESPRACVLPYPSLRYMWPERSSSTGYRLALPAGGLPAEVLDQLGPGAGVDAAFGGADGFSAVSPVVFQLPASAEPSSLPVAGGSVVMVWDATTGERLDVRAELAADAFRYRAAGSVLMVWPRVTWPYGHRIVVAVTDRLRFVAGSPSRPAVDERVLDILVAQPGAPTPASVLDATAFVVRSRANALGNLDALTAGVRADPHPVRAVRAESWPFVAGTVLVTGEVALTDYRDPDGVIPSSSPPSRRTLWTPFSMVLPLQPRTGRGAPVAIYGHGISTSKESMIFVADRNARAGIATIGIDIPNHGTRTQEGGYLLELASPGKFGRLVGMVLQGELDQLSLLLAVRSSLRGLDLVTTGRPLPAPDGRPDLNVDRVYYQGTSMGGFLGVSFLAMAPEVEAAFLQVPGSGTVDTLYHSLLWSLFTSVLPSRVSAGESAALVGTAAMLFDRADNANVAERVRRSAVPVRVVYAAYDGTVPNPSTDRLLRLLDLPLAGPLLAPAVGVRLVGAAPPDPDRVATQIDTAGQRQSWAAALLTHTAFIDPGPMADLDAWLSRRPR